jgi:class III poly(R)-hydroxyalkanoic acid synthase PhaE subunit
MDPTRDFEALSRQYWSNWGDMLRNATQAAAPAQPPGAQAWHDAVDWWTQMAHGQRGEVNAAVDRFNSQARGWFGAMQQVAAQFAGKNAGAHDISQAWKQALGAVGENPFPELFRAMRGQGQQGLDQWIEDASPFLDAWKREAGSWLGMPAFGFAREHQERWQALAQAQIDLQQQNSAYNALMMKSAQRAYEVFEQKLEARGKSGDRLQSARAMFDLWIDAAEEAYAEIALSPEFRSVYGKLVDAQMRVRGGVQREVAQMTGSLGIPTRDEVDAAHKKIAQLEREVRKLRDALLDARPAKPAASPARANEPSLKVQGDKILGNAKSAPAKPAAAKKKGKRA